MNKNIEKMLMAVVTYGEVYSKGKYNSNYDIIQQFVMYVIIKDNLAEITSADVRNALIKRFEFVNLPIAVIERTLQNMQAKKLIELKTVEMKKYFIVNREKLNEDFNCDEIDAYEKDVQDNIELIKIALYSYFEKEYDRKLSEKDYDEIIGKYNSFIKNAFWMEDDNSEISKFIMKSEPQIRNLVQQNINSYIIFEGINYDIQNLDLKLNKDIILFLDMEILFDISGYNGSYHQERALEMIKYISEINKIRNKTIQLSYLHKTKIYLDDFFNTASKIIFDRSYDYKINTAMEFIREKCNEKYDVVVLKNEFFSQLDKRYGIKENTENYFGEEYKKYNLSKEFYDIATYAQISNNKNEDDINDGITYFDVVMKKRQNMRCSNFFDCSSIFVTETKTLREMSKFLTSDGGELADNYKLSITINEVTNILWLKLGKGLGNISSVKSNDVTMLAKMIIARDYTKKLNDKCKAEKQKLNNGETSKEAYIDSIAELRTNKELIQPENITENNIDIDFDAVLRAEASRRQDKIEKDNMSKELNEAKGEMEILKAELNKYKEKERIEIEQKEQKRIKKQNTKKIINRFVFGIVFIIALLGTWYFYKHNESFFVFACGIASLASFIWLLKEVFANKK